ncbi:hypothetical protein NQZ68_014282 [Dissostichus eleginoides]|nr:hypothetical protein NQZ68_014282 [Dissostichus eleginoides]
MPLLLVTSAREIFRLNGARTSPGFFVYLQAVSLSYRRKKLLRANSFPSSHVSRSAERESIPSIKAQKAHRPWMDPTIRHSFISPSYMRPLSEKTGTSAQWNMTLGSNLQMEFLVPSAAVSRSAYPIVCSKTSQELPFLYKCIQCLTRF